MSEQREKYQLTIAALPDSAPPIIRLRRVIKSLLRAYGFRLLKCVEVHDASPAVVDAAPVALGDSHVEL